MASESGVILRAVDLGRRFYRRRGAFRHVPFYAVRSLDILVRTGEVVAIIGESGCGKTTLSRMLIGMLRSSEGRAEVHMDGQWREVASLDAASEVAFRRNVQMVYQESDLALDPVASVLESVAEGYSVNWPGVSQEQARRYSMRLLHELGLEARHWRAYPASMSGGERKRAVIARAFAALGYGLLGGPGQEAPPPQGRLVIADEPTAGLDCATQALVLSFFLRRQEEMGLACVLISHDLAMVRAFANSVLVMFGGRVVERGSVESIWPRDGGVGFMHPYSRELVGQILPNGERVRHELPSEGCIFRAECPFAETACAKPQAWQGPEHHQWACWKAERIEVRGRRSEVRE